MSNLKKVIPLACFISAGSQAVSIENPSFEDGMNGWREVDPAAISSDSFTGSKSLKITGSPARVSQTVSVKKNTDYILTAKVLGKGQIAVNTGSKFHGDRFDVQEWADARVEFNSGNADSIQIIAKHVGESVTARFDDYVLQEADGEAPVEPIDELPDNGCDRLDSLSIHDASDDGSFDRLFAPSLAIDDNIDSSSRWSSKGLGKTITFDLGSVATVRKLQAAWFKGTERSAFFDMETSLDGDNWVSVLSNAEAAGSSDLIDFDVDDSEAQYVRIVGQGNSLSTWNSITEVNILGCGDTAPVVPEPTVPDDPVPTFPGEQPTPDTPLITDLDPNKPPSENFDLSMWYVSVPSDEDGSGTADSIKERELNAGYENPEFFFTGEDGGMVFFCPVAGFKTSKNTSFPRTELREMLRRGDTSIGTQGVNENNWVFGSAPASAQAKAGGVNGTMKATLAVNHVTTTGDRSQVGRVIIGQIHANNDEPLRIYYRKLPGNSKGAIYFAHEPEGGSDRYYEMIGTRSDSASNPSDGIALGEVFSYEVNVIDDELRVSIRRDGKDDITEIVDMSDSGYDDADQYQYFKAGVYNQNNTGDDDDYVKATFYRLEVSHD